MEMAGANPRPGLPRTPLYGSLGVNTATSTDEQTVCFEVQQ